jgi:hypothetical protein
MPSQGQSATDDTPLNKKSAETGVFIHGTLDEQRSAVMKDLGNLPEVTVDFMLDHIVPNSGVNVEATISELRRQGTLLETGWKVFNGALPKNSNDNEQKVFSKMKVMYQNIIASIKFDAGHSRSPTLDVGASPDIAPASDTNIRSRPDGCGLLNSSHPIHTSQCGYSPQKKGDKEDKDYHWFNIAYVEEYKKKNTQNNLNDVCVLILKLIHFTDRFSERIENVMEFTPYDEC